MNRSESIVKIASALNKAQKNIGAAVKGAKNPFFKSTYATLGDVMEACKDALNEHGITVLQPVLSDETGDYVETVLLHESGEFISSRMKVITGKNMQELGSAISYSKRYSLQSMMFIPSEDDDGEQAVGRAKQQTKPVSTATNLYPPPSTTPTEIKTPESPVVAAKVEEKKRPTFQRSVKPNGGF